LKIKGEIQGYSDTRLDGYLERANGDRLYGGKETAFGYVKGNDRRSKWTAERLPPHDTWLISFDNNTRWILEDYEGVDFIEALDEIREAISDHADSGANTKFSIYI
jgi:hypothetical protein